MATFGPAAPFESFTVIDNIAFEGGISITIAITVAVIILIVFDIATNAITHEMQSSASSLEYH
jgi:hypothetical protein